MNSEEARELLHYWQGVLLMRDWTISVEVLRPSEMPTHDHLGACEFFADKQYAKLKLLDPAWFEGKSVCPYSPEETLVHELLHVKLGHLHKDEGSVEYKLQEWVIDSIARALVALKRSEA